MPGDNRASAKPVDSNERFSCRDGESCGPIDRKGASGDSTTAAAACQQQAVGELSNPNNSLTNRGGGADNSVMWARTNPSSDQQTRPITDAELNKILASVSIGSESRNIASIGLTDANQNSGLDLNAIDRNNPAALQRLDELARGGNFQAQREQKLIRYFKPIEIKIDGILDGSTPAGAEDLQGAKEHFLKEFGAHGGDTRTAEKYINRLIKTQHDKAEYAKDHPNEKVFYVKDKYLAACINEYAKVPGAKRTGTAAEFTDKEINGKLLRLVAAIGYPERKVNQGQIGSCALHSGTKYVIEKRPDIIAKDVAKVLTKGEYRGVFTKRDMSAESGQTDMDHILGTIMLRNTYRNKHLSGDYGGTTATALAAGIKRLTHGQVHAVWSDNKTKSNGADLDITMGGAHCQMTIARVFNENGRKVLKEKTDNTWSGYADGSWRPIS